MTNPFGTESTSQELFFSSKKTINQEFLPLYHFVMIGHPAIHRPLNPNKDLSFVHPIDYIPQQKEYDQSRKNSHSYIPCPGE